MRLIKKSMRKVAVLAPRKKVNSYPPMRSMKSHMRKVVGVVMRKKLNLKVISKPPMRTMKAGPNVTVLKKHVFMKGGKARQRVLPMKALTVKAVVPMKVLGMKAAKLPMKTVPMKVATAIVAVSQKSLKVLPPLKKRAQTNTATTLISMKSAMLSGGSKRGGLRLPGVAMKQSGVPGLVGGRPKQIPMKSPSPPPPPPPMKQTTTGLKRAASALTPPQQRLGALARLVNPKSVVSVSPPLPAAKKTTFKVVKPPTAEEKRAARVPKALNTAAQAGRLKPGTAELQPRADPAQLSLLEENAVGPEGQKDYEKRVETILKYADTNSRQADTNEDLTQLMLDKWDDDYIKGMTVDDGKKDLAALEHHIPELTSMVERLRRSLKGWGKKAPGGTRDPISEASVATLCNEAILQDEALKALCFWLQYRTYLRPGEILGLFVRDLLAPNPRLGSHFWDVVTGALEGGKPTKTGQWDISVPLDMKDEWLDDYLRALIDGRDPNEPLWNFNLMEYELCIKKAAVSSGQEALNIVPYTLRHSGATVDLAMRRRTEIDVMRRGRWQSQTSLARYGKPGVLHKSLSKLSPEVQNHLAACEKNLKAIFAGKMAPIRFSR